MMFNDLSHQNNWLHENQSLNRVNRYNQNRYKEIVLYFYANERRQHIQNEKKELLSSVDQLQYLIALVTKNRICITKAIFNAEN
jgi:PhoPQ-activated pathogenicity-related protein